MKFLPASTDFPSPVNRVCLIPAYKRFAALGPQDCPRAISRAEGQSVDAGKNFIVDFFLGHPVEMKNYKNAKIVGARYIEQSSYAQCLLHLPQCAGKKA